LVGASVTLTSTLSTTAATGTVSFEDGTTVLGTGTVSSGVATLAVSTLQAGTHVLTAVYSGDGTYGGAVSTTLYQVVTSTSKTASSVTVTSSLNPSVVGASVTLTATVPSGATGTVGFYDGATSPAMSLGTGTVSSGAATLTLTTLQAGTHPITAVYSGDGSYNSSTSSVLSQVVTKSSVTVSGVTANNKVYDGTTAATVNLSGATLSGVLSGDASRVSLNASEVTAMFAQANVGTNIAVTVTGLTLTGPAASNYTLTQPSGIVANITQAASKTTLTASSTQVNPLQSVTLTAQVASTTAGTPTGTVSFYDGGTLLGTAMLVNGTATYSATALSAGAQHILSASYNGDVNFTPSSSTTTVTVTVGSLDFSLSLSGLAGQTVTAGNTATYQFGVAPLYGQYPGTVTFSVSGLPAGATATFSPSSVAANGGTQAITLTIQTAATTAMTSPWQPGRAWPLTTLAILLIPFSCARNLRRHGRKLGQKAAFLLLLLVSILGISALTTGCGGHTGFAGQTGHTYDLTVTATSGTVSHSATVTLTIE
jgi:hypothetical protein